LALEIRFVIYPSKVKNANEHMKDHIFELRRMISLEFTTHLLWKPDGSLESEVLYTSNILAPREDNISLATFLDRSLITKF